MTFQEGFWIPITHYAQMKGMSITTIRRYIKAEKVRTRIDRGRYQIFVEGTEFKRSEMKASALLELENQKLKQELQKYKEEINDLRMLVQIYEGQQPQSHPPALPQDFS